MGIHLKTRIEAEISLAAIKSRRFCFTLRQASLQGFTFGGKPNNPARETLCSRFRLLLPECLPFSRADYWHTSSFLIFSLDGRNGRKSAQLRPDQQSG
jgi:hypothetical protein